MADLKNKIGIPFAVFLAFSETCFAEEHHNRV